MMKYRSIKIDYYTSSSVNCNYKRYLIFEFYQWFKVYIRSQSADLKLPKPLLIFIFSELI